MSARVQSRRPTSKRRLSEGTSSSMRKAVRDLDLNRAPDGGASASSPTDPLPSALQSLPPLPRPPAAPAAQPPPIGGGQAIVIPDEDDDVVLLSSPTNPSQVRGVPTIPVILIDEDSDIQQGHSHSGVIVQEPVSRLPLYGYNRSERNPRKRVFINCDEYESRNYYPCTKVVETVQLQEVVPTPPPPPKEPLFNCSICLGELNDATSTMCGHIFCQKCINAVMKTQNKKCPTCRNKLTAKGIHRVYLPTTK